MISSSWIWPHQVIIEQLLNDLLRDPEDDGQVHDGPLLVLLPSVPEVVSDLDDGLFFFAES